MYSRFVKLLAMLGAAPALGRAFLPEDSGPRRENVLVLSDSLLKPGDTIEQVRANMAEVAGGVEEHLPPVPRPAR